MNRLVGSLPLIALPTSAFAAGDDLSPMIAIPLAAIYGAILIAPPSIALGFVLQRFMRFRNAVALLATGLLAFLAWRGFETFAVLLLMFSPFFFGMGWHFGIRDAKRRTAYQQFA
jgi:hypothetical protein